MCGRWKRKPPNSCSPHRVRRKWPVLLSVSLPPSLSSPSILLRAWRRQSGSSPPRPRGFWTCQASRSAQKSMFKTELRGVGGLGVGCGGWIWQWGGQGWIPQEARASVLWCTACISYHHHWLGYETPGAASGIITPPPRLQRRRHSSISQNSSLSFQSSALIV